MASFSDNELKALAINAMGRSSEAASLPVMELGLADNVDKDGIVRSKYNSGYSLGFFQWDFGAKDQQSAKDLVSSYNAWAKLHPQYPQINVDSSVALLTKHGKPELNKPAAEVLSGQPDLRLSPLGKNLNAFLKSPKGFEFNLSLQERQYNEILKPALNEALATPALQKMSREDASIVLAALGKTKNQAGFIDSKKWPHDKKILPLLQDRNVTKEQILNKIKSAHTDVVDKGVDATVRGAELFNKISNDQGRLGKVFRAQIALDPTLVKSGFQTHAEPQILDAMFRNPKEGKQLIDAVNSGREFQIDNHANKISNEAYSVGVTADGKLYSVDKSGRGFYAGRDGHWHTLNQLQDIGVQFKTQATPNKDKRTEVDMPTPTLAGNTEPALTLDAQHKTSPHRDLTPEEMRIAAQIRDCCHAPHNEGRFDRLSSEQQDNLVAALLPGAMRWAGNPGTGVNDVGRVVMTEKGFSAVEMGRLNLPGACLETDKAIWQPQEQSLALVDHQHDKMLDQQRQNDLAKNHGGQSGPTHTL